MPKQEGKRIRIKLKAFDHRLLELAVKQITEAVQRSGAQVIGPIPLPTHTQKFCVIRSPFIDKDSREQFEIRTHKRIIDIINPTPKTIDTLAHLQVGSGVSVEIKL